MLKGGYKNGLVKSSPKSNTIKLDAFGTSLEKLASK